MVSIDIIVRPPLGRTDLTCYFEQLSMLRAEDTAIFHLAAEHHSVTPLDYGRIMHLIVTWGRSQARLVLKVPGVSADIIGDLLARSDLILTAAILADEVVDDAGLQVTDSARDHYDGTLASRNAFDGNESLPQTVVLPVHIPSFAHSPSIHSEDAGKWRVDEKARSLFHRIWPDERKPDSLREPYSELQEVREEPINAPPRITRWTLDRKGPRSTLGAVAFRPRGVVRQIIQSHRVREKSIEDELGEVLFELVQNAETHGLRPADGRTGRAVRVIRFSEWWCLRDDIAVLEEADPDLATYVRGAFELSDAHISVRSKGVAFCAITVVDSGIGLPRSAAMALKESHLLTRDNEADYLRAALDSALRVSFKQLGNIGLPRVQLLMSNLKGFMSIRSGHLEIRRDFAKIPLPVPSPRTPEAESRFVDWISARDGEFDIGPQAGTEVSLLIPVSFEDGILQT